MERPRHGVNGWILEDYDWDPETGVATMEYSRRVEGVKERETVFITANHPALPTHEGWNLNFSLWSHRQIRPISPEVVGN